MLEKNVVAAKIHGLQKLVRRMHDREVSCRVVKNVHTKSDLARFRIRVYCPPPGSISIPWPDRIPILPSEA